jgi:rhodanese-related sulfurtransferase
MVEPELPNLSTDEVLATLADGGRPSWLVHVTDRTAFRDGHIPGALARPQEEVLHRLGAIAMIVVYGEDEHAELAPALVAALQGSGVEVAWYSGGLAAWRRAGRPVERSG